MPSKEADTFTKALAKVMQEERAKQKLSQESWAAVSGVDRATISRWERLERIPGILALYDLAHGLGYSLTHFIDEAETGKKSKVTQ